MIEIIPATDIIGGQCVRLTQGDYASRKTYYRDPLEAALRFEEAGIRRLHMVDLDGAKASEPRNLAVLERIAARTSLEVQYGGGIKSREALHSVFDAGARRAICGSVAVRRPDLFAAWLAEFDPGRLILGADVRNGAVAIEGWLESSTLSAPELIGRFIPQGLTQVICTDISRDDELRAVSGGDGVDQRGVGHGGAVEGDLVGSGVEQPGGVVDRRNAASDGERDVDARGDARDQLREGAASLLRGADVEVDQFVGPFGGVFRTQLHGIADLAQSHEVDALDGLSVADVEAGDYAFGKHRARSLRVMRPS